MSDTARPAEQWLSVVDWEGIYEVSDHGRVRSVDRLLLQANGYERRKFGRILKLTAGNRGYPTVGLSRLGRHETRTVHHLVTRAFLGPMPPGREVRHLNGNRLDSRLVNLAYGTPSENMYDVVRHGHHYQDRKARCPLAHRLTELNLVKSTLADGRRECLSCARARARLRRNPGWDLKVTADAYYRQIMTGDATNGLERGPQAQCTRRGHLLAAPNLCPSALRAGRRQCLACKKAHGLVRYRPWLDRDKLSDEYFATIMGLVG